MLSGETANGTYPVESVAMMAKIITETEESPFDDVLVTLPLHAPSEYATVVRSAYELGRSMDISAIFVFTRSGYTARLLSHFRPQKRIFVVTDSEKTQRETSIVWGLESFLEKEGTAEKKLQKLIAKQKIAGTIHAGENIIVVCGKDFEKTTPALVGVQKIV